MPFLEIDRNPVTSAMAGASVLRSYESSDVLVSYINWPNSASQYFNAIGNIVIGDKFLVRANGTYGLSSSYEIVSDISSSATSFTPAEYALGAAVLYRPLTFISIEAGIKYCTSKLSPFDKYGAIAADLMVRGHLSGFSIGAGISNLGSKVGGYGIPSAAVLAVSYDNGVGAMHRVRPEVDAKYYFSGVFGVSAGVDYSFRDILSVRAGYHYGGVVGNYASVGLGIKFKGVHIDASYLFNSLFCIGLGYSF